MTFMYSKGRKNKILFMYENKFKYVLVLKGYFCNFFFNLSQFLRISKLKMAFLF